MNLIIDIGNTRLKTGIMDRGSIIETQTQGELNIPALNQLRINYPDLKRAIVSSVKKIPGELIKYLQSHFAYHILLNSETPLPIKNLYQSKDSLGYDRIAACVGAHSLYTQNALLVIDAGTAITFDVVVKNSYLGGTISPGLNMRFKALNTFTEKLPLLEKDNNYHIIGKNTNEAIISGVQNGIIFEMDQYINRLKTEYSDLKVILTGGDAIFFDKKLKNTIFVDPNILLTGLNRILDYNAK